MTRVYGSGAEVRRRDDQPEQFLWRDRLYLVQAVLGHWLEAGGWWRPARGSSFRNGACDDREREFWRVEAAMGRLGQSGVFDLSFDWSSGTWSVVRVQD